MPSGSDRSLGVLMRATCSEKPHHFASFQQLPMRSVLNQNFDLKAEAGLVPSIRAKAENRSTGASTQSQTNRKRTTDES
jgi:hypothetical protein